MNGGTGVHDVVHGGGMMSYIYNFQLPNVWATIFTRGRILRAPDVPTSANTLKNYCSLWDEVKGARTIAKGMCIY